jgi:beta-galactosidase GanA
LNPLVYFFWSFHSASEDTFDFENGAHDVQRVFDYAKQAGALVRVLPIWPLDAHNANPPAEVSALQ